jgi:hypothetical protein
MVFTMKKKKNKQTNKKKKKQAGFGLGEWKNADNSPITTFPDSIPYHDARVYGGQQFKRLLASFGQVVHNSTMSEASIETMATAAGINRLNNLPNYAWAACEIASQVVWVVCWVVCVLIRVCAFAGGA